MTKKWLLISFPLLLGGCIATYGNNSDDVEKINENVEQSSVEKEKKVYKLVEVDEDVEFGKESSYNKSSVDHKENSSIQNVLVIGVDEGGFDSSRSDVMIVASIDTENKDVKLTSVMRDTLSYIPTSNTYQKLNHSYMEGGPEETMLAFNTNFDLDIEDYVVFDFRAVEQVVDLIGGYPAHIDAGESKDMKMPVGDYVLAGEEAVRYMRVRYNSGGDTGRNQRQRDLMEYVMKKAMDLGKIDMLSLASKVMPSIRTSYSLFDVKELVNMYSIIDSELTIEQSSFPSEYVGTKLNDGLWYAIPKSMEENVYKLHEDIYNTKDLGISDRVNNISKNIQNKSGVY